MKNNLLVTQHHCRVKPCGTSDAQAGVISYMRRKLRMKQPAGPAGERILVAEDDRFLRTLVGTVLYRSGYTIIEAVDGEDAVHKFYNSPEAIDLLLLDMDMPKKNGKEVYDEIRQTKPDIKVMFAGAYPGEVMQSRGMIDEDTHFLAKPFGPRLLLKKIREVLDG